MVNFEFVIISEKSDAPFRVNRVKTLSSYDIFKYYMSGIPRSHYSDTDYYQNQ